MPDPATDTATAALGLTPGVGAAITGGLALVEGLMGYQAQQQEYANQVAFKAATDEYAQWSAEMQAAQTDLNNQYQFWQERVNYGQQLAYAGQMRNYELSKSIASAEEVARARASAGADYALASQAISEGHAQQAMADAVSMMAYKVQTLKAQSAIAAGATGGKSVDRLINDYARQAGDMQTLKNINARFRDGQYSRQQAGQIAQYLNQYNSQKFYQMQEVNDPIAPFPPLPTLVNPAAPSSVGGAPSLGTALVGSVAGAVKQGIGTYGSLKKFTQ